MWCRRVAVLVSEAVGLLASLAYAFFESKDCMVVCQNRCSYLGVVFVFGDADILLFS